MKYALVPLVLLCSASFFSCKKYVGVPVAVHDTTVTTIRDTVRDTTEVVSNTPTLIGKWSNGVWNDLQPAFGADTLDWGSGGKMLYLASQDSIYQKGIYGQTIHCWYAYRISPSNDTLWLTYMDVASKPVKAYVRVH